jgi:hypothetical protein
MNKVFLFFLTFMTITTLHTAAMARGKDLTPAELNSLFSDKTFSVENLRETGKEASKVYATDMGGLRIIAASGASSTRAWSVRENGTFCYSAPATNRKGGGTCGYIVHEGQGMYKMYKQKGKDRKGKALFLFSNFQKGKQLN